MRRTVHPHWRSLHPWQHQGSARSGINEGELRERPVKEVEREGKLKEVIDMLMFNLYVIVMVDLSWLNV